MESMEVPPGTAEHRGRAKVQSRQEPVLGRDVDLAAFFSVAHAKRAKEAARARLLIRRAVRAPTVER